MHSIQIEKWIGKFFFSYFLQLCTLQCVPFRLCVNFIFGYNCSASIQFKLLTKNYDLPVVKPKRQSYEWYHPKGILKRNWILKHLHVLPAVIVLFEDLEWNDPEWTEKQYQCVSTMQTIKNSIQVTNFTKTICD